MSLFDQIVSREITRRRQVETTREKELADPTKTRNAVAKMMRSSVPAGKKVRTSKHPTKLAAVEAAISEEDPRSKLGSSIVASYEKALQNPEFAGYRPRNILRAVTEMESSKIEVPTRKFIQKQKVGTFSTFMKEPYAPMPGQEEWEAAHPPRMLHERAEKSFAYGVGTKAAIEAGKFAFGKGPAARMGRRKAIALLAKAGPYGKLAAAGVGFIAGTRVFEEVSTRTTEQIKKTEYGKEHPVAAELIGMGTGLVTGLAVPVETMFGGMLTSVGAKSITRFQQLLKRKSAVGKTTMENPAAEEIIKFKEATLAAEKASDKAVAVIDKDKAAVMKGLVEKVEGEATKKKAAAIPLPGAVARRGIWTPEGLEAIQRRGKVPILPAEGVIKHTAAEKERILKGLTPGVPATIGAERGGPLALRSIARPGTIFAPTPRVAGKPSGLKVPEKAISIEEVTPNLPALKSDGSISTLGSRKVVKYDYENIKSEEGFDRVLSEVAEGKKAGRVVQKVGEMEEGITRHSKVIPTKKITINFKKRMSGLGYDAEEIAAMNEKVAANIERFSKKKAPSTLLDKALREPVKTSKIDLSVKSTEEKLYNWAKTLSPQQRNLAVEKGAITPEINKRIVREQRAVIEKGAAYKETIAKESEESLSSAGTGGIPKEDGSYSLGKAEFVSRMMMDKKGEVDSKALAAVTGIGLMGALSMPNEAEAGKMSQLAKLFKPATFKEASKAGKKIGVEYNGVQEGLEGPIGHLFTDSKTKSTFFSSSAAPAEVQKALETNRAKWGITEKVAGAAIAGGTITSLTPDEAEASYVGEMAKLGKAAFSALRASKLAEKAGRDVGRTGEIRKETGWFKAPDEKWRFEISDAEAALKKDISKTVKADYTLDSVYHHPKLYELYPDLKDIKVMVRSSKFGYESGEGSYHAGTITLGAGKPGTIKRVLAHEIQHAVQGMEGFAKGGSPARVPIEVIRNESKSLLHSNKEYRYIKERLGHESKSRERDILERKRSDILHKHMKSKFGKDTAKSIYYRQHGEIEARDVEKRLSMTEQARQRLSPYIMDMVPRGIREEDIVKTFHRAVTAAAATFTLADIFSPDEAEAAGIVDLGRTLSGLTATILKEAKPSKVKELVKEMKGSGLIHKSQVDHCYVLPEPAKSLNIVPDVKHITKKKSMPPGMEAIASPHVQFLYYTGVREGQELMNNAGVQWASCQNTAIKNTMDGHKTLMNILEDFIPNYGSSAKEAIKELAPVVDKFHVPMQERAYNLGMSKKLKQSYEKEFSKLTKRRKFKKGEADEGLAMVTRLEALYKEHDAAYKASTAMKDEYQAAWTAAMKPFASKAENSGTRIFLAAEDTASFENYPWLKDIVTWEEKAAAAKLKDMMEHYAVRAIEAGEKVITTRPFMHHAWHPAMKSELARLNKGATLMSPPMTKLHSRSAGYMPMVPDAEYSVTSYLQDINIRLEAMEFWKKGEKDGWWAYKKWITENPSQCPEGLIKAFNQFEKGFKPVDTSGGFNKFSEKVYALEVARLLAFSASVPFKHALKLIADLRVFGVEGVKAIPKAAIAVTKIAIKQRGGEAWLKKHGFGLDHMDEAVEAYTETGKLYRIVSDISPFRVNESMADKALSKFNEIGGTPTSIVERFDRSLSVVAGMNMAAKRGMTPAQATYSVFDTILKSNFLSGQLNPSLLRNPFIRLMMIFQGTPHKILEQRVALHGRAWKGVADTLAQLRRDVIRGEQDFKWEIIKQGFGKQKDVFGNTLLSQSIREMVLVGTGITAGEYVWGADLRHHFFHIPYFKPQRRDIAIGASPLVNASLETYSKYMDEDYDDFVVSTFFNSWFDSSYKGLPAPIPVNFKKVIRLTENDIPERYRDSKLRYLFGIPAYDHD